MGKFSNSAFGNIKGKVGGQVAYRAKGQNIVRSRPTSVKNPRTAAQLAQRGAMAATVELSKYLAPAIKLGFPTRPLRQSAFNAFVSKNVGSCTQVQNDVLTLIYGNVKVASGSLAKPAITSADKMTANTVKVQFTSTVDGVTGSPTDKVHVVVFDEAGMQAAHGETARVANGNITVAFPAELANAASVHAYAFAVSANKAKASDSDYSAVVE